MLGSCVRFTNAPSANWNSGDCRHRCSVSGDPASLLLLLARHGMRVDVLRIEQFGTIARPNCTITRCHGVLVVDETGADRSWLLLAQPCVAGSEVDTLELPVGVRLRTPQERGRLRALRGKSVGVATRSAELRMPSSLVALVRASMAGASNADEPLLREHRLQAPASSARHVSLHGRIRRRG